MGPRAVGGSNCLRWHRAPPRSTVREGPFAEPAGPDGPPAGTRAAPSPCSLRRPGRGRGRRCRPSLRGRGVGGLPAVGAGRPRVCRLQTPEAGRVVDSPTPTLPWSRAPAWTKPPAARSLHEARRHPWHPGARDSTAALGSGPLEQARRRRKARTFRNAAPDRRRPRPCLQSAPARSAADGRCRAALRPSLGTRRKTDLGFADQLQQLVNAHTWDRGAPSPSAASPHPVGTGPVGRTWQVGRERPAAEPRAKAELTGLRVARGPGILGRNHCQPWRGDPSLWLVSLVRGAVGGQPGGRPPSLFVERPAAGSRQPRSCEALATCGHGRLRPPGRGGAGGQLPLLARCRMVSICSPDSFAFFIADVARGQPDKLGTEDGGGH